MKAIAIILLAAFSNLLYAKYEKLVDVSVEQRAFALSDCVKMHVLIGKKFVTLFQFNECTGEKELLFTQMHADISKNALMVEDGNRVPERVFTDTYWVQAGGWRIQYEIRIYHYADGSTEKSIFEVQRIPPSGSDSSNDTRTK